MAVSPPRPAPDGAALLAAEIHRARAADVAVALVDCRTGADDVLALGPGAAVARVGPATVAWLVAGEPAGPCADARTTVLRVRSGGRAGPAGPLALAWAPCGCPAAHPAWGEPAACPVRRERLARLVVRAGLSDDEADALVLRLGLDGGPVLTMDAVGRELAVTPAAAARLVGAALARVARAAG